MEAVTTISISTCGAGTKSGVALGLVKWPNRLIQLKKEAVEHSFPEFWGEVIVVFDENPENITLPLIESVTLSDGTTFQAHPDTTDPLGK